MYKVLSKMFLLLLITASSGLSQTNWWTSSYEGDVVPDQNSPTAVINYAFSSVQGFVENGAYHIIDNSTAQGSGAGSWKFYETFGSEYTIEFGVKCLSASPDGDHCFTNQISASTRAQIFDGTQGITLDFSPTHLYVVDVAAGNDCPAEAAADLVNEFHAVKIVKSNEQFSVYLDGVHVTTTTSYSDSRSYIVWGSMHYAGTGEGIWDYIRWNPNDAPPLDCETETDWTQPYISDDCTIGLWPLDEGVGNDANDESNYENHGTIVGTPGWDIGHFDNALHCGGTNFVNVPTSPEMMGMNQLTLECWFKLDSYGHDFWNYLIQKDYSYLFMVVDNDQSLANKLWIQIRTSTGIYNVFSDQTIPLNEWHHGAAVYDGLTLSLYIDGEFENSIPASGTIINTSGPLYIGANYLGYQTERPLHGWIDEVRISNTAREFVITSSSLTGYVQSDGSGLYSIPINLVDQFGELYESTITDEFGFYQFEEIPAGDYTVEIQVPLGYTPISDPMVPITLAGVDREVNFSLEENLNTGCVRQAWFWNWQVKCALRGWGWAKYSGTELLDMLEQMSPHFDPYFYSIFQKPHLELSQRSVFLPDLEWENRIWQIKPDSFPPIRKHLGI